MTDISSAPYRRVDLLAYEHSHGRLSPSAVTVGRGIETALEAAQRSAGSAWRERVDGSPDLEAGTLAGLDAVHRARVALDRVALVVGARGAMLLRDLLADGLSFEQLAQRHGRPTRRGIASVASQVRADLESLARARATTGRASAPVQDKHSEAADALGACTVR